MIGVAVMLTAPLGPLALYAPWWDVQGPSRWQSNGRKKFERRDAQPL